MKKILLLMIISMILLSGCNGKTANEDNIYLESKTGYALIVLSDETEMPTGDFRFVSSKSAFWEWDDDFAKFKDSNDNVYVVKIYYNNLDYRISKNDDVLVDTMFHKEDDFE